LTKYCSDCGKPLENETSKFCNDCGAKQNTNNIIEKQESVKIVHVPEEKNPFLAAICSFFIPGLGQVYNGETALGVAVFLGTVIGAFIFLIPGLIVWIFGMYNAYTIATKMNTGEIPFKPTKTAHMILFFILAMFIVAIIIVFLILAAFAAFVSSFAHPIKITYLLV
jgi:TM2 domain-containing membrane protein YozV